MARPTTGPAAALPAFVVSLLLAIPGFAADAPPCAACVVVTVSPGQTAALPAALAGIELVVRVPAGREEEARDMLASIAERGGRPGLLIEGLPATPLAPALLAHARTVIARVADDGVDPDALAFELKTRLTAIRGAAGGTVALGVSATADLLVTLGARDLGPYVDFVVSRADVRIDRAREQWFEGGVLTDVALAVVASGQVNAERTLWRGPEDIDLLEPLLRDLARVFPMLPHGLVRDEHAAANCGDRREQGWLNPVSLDRVFFVRRCDPAKIAVTPAAEDAEHVTLSSGAVLVRLPAAAADHFAEGIQVSAARELTVEEILARHQAAAARQAAIVRTMISTGTLTLTFEAPGFPAPIAITSQSVIYTDDGRIDVEQRNVLVNGIAFRGRGVPRLPLLEPERAASPPLAITLTDVYRYRLQGRETVADTPCYVLAFEPAVQGRSLFKGRAWIAADSFAMVRVAAAQTGLRGPIVSSEQTDEFRPQDDGVWLLARSDVRQVYEGPGHRTPIQRVLEIQRHEINSPRFGERRQAAYASDSVMLRDTPQGYRYLRRPDPERRDAAPGASAEPVLAGRATRIRTLAFGVIVDPNITRPLPFAGLSYVDLDLFGTGAQLNGFFGGTYGQLAVSIPSIGGSAWQLAGRAFGIASAFNDRAFSQGQEEYRQNILQRPLHASVWVLRPLTARVSLRAGYDFDHTHFEAAATTSEDFAVPASEVAHGLRLALEGQRAGWSGAIWWNPARRTGWRAWGGAGDYAERHHDFQRYGASISRSAVVTPALVARAEAAWMSGHDLDRFSRYSFGAFDNRLRGYPAALIRYDRGAVLRGAAAWSVARRVRLDGFVDHAYVQDPGIGVQPTGLTGFGMAVEAPAPFGTLLAVEWGYGLQGINRDGRRGTHVVRISGYKMF